MAVYRQNYKPYQGTITSPRWRFMILPRYAFQSIFESRPLVAFYVLCFVPLVVAASLIYLQYSAEALASLRIRALAVVEIDAVFFGALFRIQTFLAFLLVTFIGPGLITPDVANNALPLYLSKPLSRKEYVAGKLAVLLGMASLITWMPGLGLIGIQADLAGPQWLSDHSGIATGFFLGSWIWIVTVSLVSLAVSAWFKWRPVAAASMLGLFFIAAGFGSVMNDMLQFESEWGILLNLSTVIAMIFDWFSEGVTQRGSVPSWAALASMGALSAASVFVLYKKIRACEVIR